MALIDSEEFRRRALQVYPEYWEDVLDEMPTVDAVEVKHGKWIFDSNAVFRCSVCGDHMVRNVFPFCPWCGSKMEA